MNALRKLSPLLFLGGLFVPLGCKSGSTSPPPPPGTQTRRAEISNEFTAKAEVIAVSPADRVLTVRREDGTQFDVAVGSGVRNFDQVAVGDSLRLRYQETLAAELRPAGEPATSLHGAAAAARAPKGAKPGAGLGMGVSLRVKIESLDLARDIVVFSPESGELIARRLATPQGREFARGLKVGDTVQLDYVEVLALAVEEL
jgi:hypothetical protein